MTDAERAQAALRRYRRQLEIRLARNRCRRRSPRRLPVIPIPAELQPFYDTIEANPDDDLPRLVLADFLEEREHVATCHTCDGSGYGATIVKPNGSTVRGECITCKGKGSFPNWWGLRAKFIRESIEFEKLETYDERRKCLESFDRYAQECGTFPLTGNDRSRWEVGVSYGKAVYTPGPHAFRRGFVERITAVMHSVRTGHVTQLHDNVRPRTIRHLQILIHSTNAADLASDFRRDLPRWVRCFEICNTNEVWNAGRRESAEHHLGRFLFSADTHPNFRHLHIYRATAEVRESLLAWYADRRPEVRVTFGIDGAEGSGSGIQSGYMSDMPTSAGNRERRTSRVSNLMFGGAGQGPVIMPPGAFMLDPPG